MQESDNFQKLLFYCECLSLPKKSLLIKHLLDDSQYVDVEDLKKVFRDLFNQDPNDTSYHPIFATDFIDFLQSLLKDLEKKSIYSLLATSLKCPKCRGTSIVKNGTRPNFIQRYRCKDCGYRFDR